MCIRDRRDGVDGVAFHWYSGSHFDGLQAVHECFPEKELLETEFCTDIDQHPPEDFDAALLYAEDIAGNLRHWTNGIIDWNLMLDMQGGPYHDREGGCLAPVLVDGDDYRLTGAYWGLCHFSHVIRPGAVRIGASVYDERISCAAAVNPDGSIGSVGSQHLAKRGLGKVIFNFGDAVIGAGKLDIHSLGVY